MSDFREKTQRKAAWTNFSSQKPGSGGLCQCKQVSRAGLNGSF